MKKPRTPKSTREAADAARTSTRRGAENIPGKSPQKFPVETWPIERPIPYARNPRKNSGAVAKVAASLKEFGWHQPIVVDEAGVILAGHTRLLAAQQLGMTKVPVHIAAGLSKAQAKAYRIMDNRAGEEADWDFELLNVELTELKDEGFDLDLTGFDASALTPDFAPGTAEDQGRLDQKNKVKCPECGHEF